ncbi:TPA: hypothetical protein TUS99_001730 [Streptococcus equi subsp. zooepidemicus]|uniref:YopX family protein n=1 Tax=Streptococcus equi TaxID=1336 RepID=UPI0024A88085|nr:YopX family protein [Streptococcus equi]MDI5988660.1 YopX family protein [Streptococcus equi subsp. zooepidemicus]HEL0558399.1 hypothetical protein [Streptococcus equi subsp. zooepidemicus]HEL0586230.1 hypothetical protein [Streptococcus equi subsp. zooepidemicus]HEL1253151.1 hypothetical protein [Streptococcus equi subsp. zooepidemicus]HEL1291712.1 hypothetical protein [Streptococcus equi subsp. zooepidemicus]
MILKGLTKVHKFRVWDLLYKKMNPVDKIDYRNRKIYPVCKEEYKRSVHFDEAVLMQLAYYDDNVVIYDKDILRDSHSDELVVVVYDNEDCAWKVKTETTEEWLYNWLGCDVVGNVYENPELLERVEE